MLILVGFQLGIEKNVASNFCQADDIEAYCLLLLNKYVYAPFQDFSFCIFS